MTIDLKRENLNIVRIGESSAVRKVSDSVRLDTAALALYLLDNTNPQSQEALGLEALVAIMNARISWLVKGRDYSLDILASTIMLEWHVMDSLIDLARPMQKDPPLDSAATLQWRHLSYEQILSFFWVSSWSSKDILRWIFHLWLSKVFAPNDMPPLIPSPTGLYKNSAALNPHYQNLDEGYFLSEVLIWKLIEASRGRLRSDPHLLARFEENIQCIDTLLPFEDSEDQASGNTQQRERIEKNTYTKGEFFNRFTEVYGLSLAVYERNMYWNMLELRQSNWFEGAEADRILSGQYIQDASKLVLIALSTRY